MASIASTNLMQLKVSSVMEFVGSDHPFIRIKNLRKSFGRRNVLNNLDLNILPGEFISILGPSGEGKTTLLRVIAGLEEPTSGQITFGKDQATIRPNIRIMFQEDRLLPWRRSIDNIVLGLPDSSRTQAEEMLRRVGLQDHAKDWPATLSGGQKQRIALARALVHRPSLLLLDEPFGSLDALTRSEMQLLLESLWTESGVTVLLVTHDIEEALRLSDRVFVLAQGRISHFVEVSLPRPRRRAHPMIADVRDELEEVIRGMKQNCQ